MTVVNSDTGQSSASKPETPESVTVESGKPMSELTDAELLDTIDKAVEELEKRNNNES